MYKEHSQKKVLQFCDSAEREKLLTMLPSMTGLTFYSKGLLEVVGFLHSQSLEA